MVNANELQTQLRPVFANYGVKKPYCSARLGDRIGGTAGIEKQLEQVLES